MRSIFNSPYVVTQAFGVNYDYYKQFGLPGHEGIDLIPQDLNDWTVISPEGDGQVVRDIDDPKQGGAYGNTVTIWYPKLKIALQFCHLRSNNLKVGDKVAKHQAIGVMGNTGNTNGAHVHLNLFEVDDNGVRLNKGNGYLGGINPLPFLQAGESNQMIPVPAKDFERIVTKSGDHDKTVEYLSLGNPDDTRFEKIKAAIGGIKSRSTDLEKQLATQTSEVKNREEQVSRLKDQVTESENLRKELVGKLNDALKGNASVVGVYEGQLKQKQTVIDEYAKAKGALATELEIAKVEIKKLKDASTAGLSLFDVVTLLVEKAIPFLKNTKLK